MYAPHSPSGAQSHDWHLQRAHATLANTQITSSDVRLLFLDVNEFLVLPAQAEEGCFHSSASHQVLLNAWEVSVPVPEGTGMSRSTGNVLNLC